MAGISFGDLAQSYMLQGRIGFLKTQTARLSEELATGRQSDVAAGLSGDMVGLAGLEHSRVLLKGYLTAGKQADTVGEARLAILGRLHESASKTAVAITTLSQDVDVDQVRRTADMARTRFEDTVRDLNTQIAGRFVFGGVSTTGPALADAQTILSELSALTANATTPEEIEARITTWFNSPTGFGQNFYLGGAPSSPTVLATDGTSVSDRTAAEPQIVKALTGLAIASQLDHAGLSNSGADRMALRQMAVARLYSGTDAVTDLSARIGSDLAKIDTVLSRHQAENLSYELAISDTVKADQAKTAIELEAVKTNLETVYTVTARLSRLTLAEFLR